MSSENVDSDLKQLVRRLIPIAKARALYAAELSPETFSEEIWTLAALYGIDARIEDG